jgi:TolA-binding protein
MQAVADMAMYNYAQAETVFRKVLTQFPGSHQEDNATYWRAVAMLFQEKYEEALAVLDAYPEKFPQGAWLDSAAFQKGTCLFGLERYDEALEQFTLVINRYPDSPVYPDACSLRGDIYGSRALLDEAVRDYEQAILAARTPAQAKYATFQMTAVFEAEERYDEIIRAVNDYLNRYGAEADIATGIYWIGKTKIKQGLLDEAIQSYFDAIVQYGGDLEQSGVDSMIAELVQLARFRLPAEHRDELKAEIGAVLDTSDSLTLQLRLRAMLAQIDNMELDFGKKLIGELPNLDHAAPPVLAAICDASFELQDYSRADEILTAFKTRFEDSEFMRPAFKLRAFELYRAGDDEEALKLIADAQSRYGTDSDMAWAQIMKGGLFLRQNRYDEAHEAFIGVLNVPGWRGESFAEATFRLGQTEEAAGDLLKAHGWYQRVYVQYKGYAEGNWSANAYLGAARCLQQLGLTNDARNTRRAMLFDKYVNTLPQAAEAKTALGAEEVAEIAGLMASGVKTNITVTVAAKEGEE